MWKHMKLKFSGFRDSNRGHSDLLTSSCYGLSKLFPILVFPGEWPFSAFHLEPKEAFSLGQTRNWWVPFLLVRFRTDPRPRSGPNWSLPLSLTRDTGPLWLTHRTRFPVNRRLSAPRFSLPPQSAPGRQISSFSVWFSSGSQTLLWLLEDAICGRCGSL